MAVLACALVVITVAFSSESFWIDEANTAEKATAETWAQFRQLMLDREGSDLQMPGYMAGLWAWEKVLGSSERALRAFNIPWLLLGLAALLNYWRAAPALCITTAAVLLVSPFTWYYLNEARPYVLQIGAGLLATCAAHHLIFLRVPEQRRSDLVAFLSGTLLLSLSSLFAMVLAALFFVAILAGIFSDAAERRAWRHDKCLWLITALFAFPFTALAAYYLWTLSLGIKASSVGQTTLLNLPFAFYELLGFSGLGPDRNTIRQSGLPAFYTYAPALCLLAFAYAGLIILAGKHAARSDRSWMPAAASALLLLAIGSLTGLTIGWLGEFRLLGRHLTPLFPLLLMLLGGVIHTASRNRSGRLTVLLFFTIMLASALSQRFHSRFARDDYRTATQLAMEEVRSGGIVWWAADSAAVRYYGLHPVHAGDSGSAFFANNRKDNYISALPTPSLVVFSKEDIYDNQGTLRQWLSRHHWQVTQTLPGFTLWRPAATPSNSTVE